MDRSAARARRAGTFLVLATLASWVFGGALAIAASARSAESPVPRLALPSGARAGCPEGGTLCPPVCEDQPTTPPPTPTGLASGGSSVDIIITVEIVDARCQTEEPTPPVTTPTPTPGTPKPTPPTDVLDDKFGPNDGDTGGGKLPYTGAPLAVAVAISAVLVVTGLALRAVASRPAGRHRGH